MAINSPLPVRDDVEFVTYRRRPTRAEIRFGEGAIHYREFPVVECTHYNKRLKSWFVAPDDGLRYYL